MCKSQIRSYCIAPILWALKEKNNIIQCIITMSTGCLCGAECLYLAFTPLYVYFCSKCSLHGIFDDNKLNLSWNHWELNKGKLPNNKDIWFGSSAHEKLELSFLPACIPPQISPPPLPCVQCLVFSGSCGIRDIWGRRRGWCTVNPATKRHRLRMCLFWLRGRRWVLWQLCFKAHRHDKASYEFWAAWMAAECIKVRKEMNGGRKKFAQELGARS